MSLDSIEAVVAAWRALTASQRVEVQRLAGPPRRSTPTIVHQPSERDLVANGFTRAPRSFHTPAGWRAPAQSRDELTKEKDGEIGRLRARIRELEQEVVRIDVEN